MPANMPNPMSECMNDQEGQEEFLKPEPVKPIPPEVISAINTTFPYEGKMIAHSIPNTINYRVNWHDYDTGRVINSVFVRVNETPDGFVVEDVTCAPKTKYIRPY